MNTLKLTVWMVPAMGILAGGLALAGSQMAGVVGGGACGFATAALLGGWEKIKPGHRVLWAVAIAITALGAAIAQPSAASATERGDEPSVWLGMHAWHNPNSGERWVEITPIAPAVIEEIGAAPFWLYSNIEEKVAVVGRDVVHLPEVGDTVEVLRLDVAHINDEIGRVVYQAMTAEDGLDPACAISCYDLRRASPQYDAIRRGAFNSSFASGEAAALLLIGTATVAFLAKASLGTTATVAVLSTAALSTTLGVVLTGVAVGALIAGAGVWTYAQYQAAIDAADEWARSPSSGCTACGYTAATLGWRHDAGADTCYNPDCRSGTDEDESGGDAGSSPSSGDFNGDFSFDTGRPGGAGYGGMDFSGGAWCDGTLAVANGGTCQAACGTEEPPPEEQECEYCFDDDGNVIGSNCVLAEPAETSPETTAGN